MYKTKPLGSIVDDKACLSNALALSIHTKLSVDCDVCVTLPQHDLALPIRDVLVESLWLSGLCYCVHILESPKGH